jgi:acyl transferase domain-containing protein/acyl carrier protein
VDGIEPIAIIGMALRVPGADDYAQFWRNLVDGVDSITFFDRAEQLARGVSPAALDDPNFVPAAPVLDRLEYFDAGLFGMTDREAQLADPHHRLFLETAYAALEDSGCDPYRYPGAIGVYAGAGADEYQWRNVRANRRLWAAAGDMKASLTTVNYPDYVATLASYKLNLRGPGLTVHTACSTSLVAFHLACEALRNGECDAALAGGVCVELPHGVGYIAIDGYTSPDGRCRPFDARAAGTLWGSGVGVTMLKRLSDAVDDGDHIRAVVLGNAINNDGSAKVGFSAPSVNGQAEAIAQALALAGVDPRSVGYIEAHGTGTALGDPIEVAALTRAYGAGSTERGWCGIGSVKSNIGHLSQAAGIVSVIKATLCLEHGVIPPTLHFAEPNPAIDFAATPFRVVTEQTKLAGSPRRAGVSSFGIGGTNAHVVLEEAPHRVPAAGRARPVHVLRLSAATPAALDEAATRLADHLAGNPAADLGDVAHTLRVGRVERAHRAAIVAADPAAAQRALRDPRRRTGSTATPPAPVALLFPGQGAQYAGMAAELYAHEPAFAGVVDECAELLLPVLEEDLRTVMFAPDGDDRLRETRLTQPALFVVEYALASLWRRAGLAVSAMLGHSIGEYVAAAVAGVFTLPDVLSLVATRGRLMQSVPSGAMLAIRLNEADVAARLTEGLDIAAVNAPGSCVVSGPTAVVEALAERLRAESVAITRLRTSHAFHSSMVEPILADFAEAVRRVPRHAPQQRFLSNVTGAWISPAEAVDPAYWAAHLRGTVRFGDCVATLLAEGAWTLLECGPGRQLGGLAGTQLPRGARILASLPGAAEPSSDLTVLDATAATLWASGVPLGGDALSAPGRRIPLPTYPYQRKRHWADPDPESYAALTPVALTAPEADQHAGPRELADWFAVPQWRQAVSGAAAEPVRECVAFVDGPRGDAVVAALRAAGGQVVEVRPGERLEPAPQGWQVPPADRAAYDDLVARLPAATRYVHAWALDAAPAGDDPQAATAAQERGFFAALWLVQALAAAQRADGVRLDLLCTGTEDVLGPELTHPEHATMAGIARVLPLELAGLRVTRVDVSVEVPAERVVAELGRPAAESAPAASAQSESASTGSMPTEVALRGTRRWVREYAPLRLPEPAADAGPHAGGRYLITGGLGGIGITLAEDLATRLRATEMILVSRTGLPPRAEWDAYSGNGGRTGRAVAAIRRMEAVGARVRVVALDVADTAALAALRQDLERGGGLTCIVHAAGLPGGGVAEVRSRAGAEAVLEAKLAGTLALRAAFGDMPMDTVVLCSSVTAVAGGFGQVDYCAANAYLDAHARSGRGWAARVLSLNWAGWLGVGMAAETEAPQELDAVGNAHRRWQHPVLTSLAAGAAVGMLPADRHWLLAEHRINGIPVMPGTGHIECIREAVAALVPAPSETAVVQLRDVAFLEPLSVPAGTSALYRVQVDGAEVTVTSQVGASLRTHVRASGGWVEPGPAAMTDLDAIRTRCRPVATDAGSRVSVVQLGPRWNCLREVHVGDGEALALIERPAAADADTGWVLHPALLDVATSFDGRGDGSYLPLGYGTLRVRDPLPARFLAHLRHRDSDGSEVVAADLTLYDEQGRELVAIEEYVLRRVDPAVVAANLAAPGAASEPLRSTDTAIAPADGGAAMRRVLAADPGPQVIIAPQSMPELLARARRATAETLAQTPTAQPAPASAGESLSALLARIWGEALGVQEVGEDDNFFELGGDSLVAVQLIARVRKAVGVRLPMRVLFETPTVASLAARIEQLRAAPTADRPASPPQTESAIPALAGRPRPSKEP